MPKIPDLSISPEKVFFIVSKSRQSDDSAVEMDLATESDDDLPEDHSKGTDRSELSGFIRGLNVDEQIDLVALMWLGRGDGDLESWRDLRAEASRVHNNRTASYLIGTPMLRTIWRRRCRSSENPSRISKSICDIRLDAKVASPQKRFRAKRRPVRIGKTRQKRVLGWATETLRDP